MERSQQQTMKKDDPEEIRPLSGESSGTVIDLITNDLQQGKLLYIYFIKYFDLISINAVIFLSNQINENLFISYLRHH